MNNARQHYLGTYGRVGTIDYFIKMCHMTQDRLMLHHCPRTGKSAGKCCFSHTHNDEGFGLAKKDQDYIGEKQKNWTPPNKKTRREHATYMHELKIQVETNDLKVVEVEVVE
jgi:hypothetical protein